jgi:hypothetical protein
MARVRLRLLWTLAATVLLAGLVLATDNSVFAQVTPPARFFGTAYLHGVPAQPGTVVEARIGGTFCGAGFVSASGLYSVDVASGGTVFGCGASGVPVSFTVGGLPAREVASYRGGEFIALDLTTGGRAFTAQVTIERWVRYRDEPCAGPSGEWCVIRYSIAPASQPYTSYRMLAYQYGGNVIQATDLTNVTPGVPTARVGVTSTTGIVRVVWERIQPFGGTCAGVFAGDPCIETVEVAPPIRGTVWYRLRIFQPNGNIDDPTGYISASP